MENKLLNMHWNLTFKIFSWAWVQLSLQHKSTISRAYLVHLNTIQKWLSMNHLTLSSYQHQIRGETSKLDKNKIKPATKKPPKQTEQKEQRKSKWMMRQARQRRSKRGRVREGDQKRTVYLLHYGSKHLAPPNSEKTRKRGGAERQCVRSETERNEDAARRGRKTQAQNANVHG